MEPTELRARRKALGLSRQKLAELFGMTRQQIGSWERGLTPIKPIVALAVAALEARRFASTIGTATDQCSTMG